MRVAMVCPYSWSHPGGVQRHITGLAGALEARGAAVDVLAPADGPVDEPRLRPVGRSIPIPDNGSVQRVALDPVAAARTLRLLANGGYDVVHLHEPMIPAVCLAALTAARAPLVGTFHMHAAAPRWYRTFAPVCRAALARLDARIAVSEAARRHVARVVPGDYAIVPNGIGPEAFAPRARLGEGPARILFVGRPEPRKGLAVLLDAFARLPGEPWLDVVGCGAEDVRRTGVALGAAAGRVRAHGRLAPQALHERLAGAALLCAPSLGSESFGVVLLEAMAAGLPVVASAIAGYVDVLPREAGMLVPPGDAAALAGALSALLADPDRRARLGESGRRAAEDYVWPVLAPRVLDAYAAARAHHANGGSPAASAPGAPGAAARAHHANGGSPGPGGPSRRAAASRPARPRPGVGGSRRLVMAVGTGMTAYVRVRYAVRVFGGERLPIAPGTIAACTHRSDADVPILGSLVYQAWRRRPESRLSAFAARHDLLVRGFLAGYPPWLPLAARRAAWPLDIGEVMRRRLPCLPVRTPGRMRLVEVLDARPDLPLAALPAIHADALAARARALGRPAPRRGADVLAGAYADLLWDGLGPEELAAAGVDDAWRAHRRAAVDDFGALVAHVAAGGSLVLFPEGEPSPDGRLGPLRPGLASLVRRSGAGAVTPIALAIDPLAGRRPRAYVSLGEPPAPPPADLPGAILAAWRRALPLTVGQVAARALAEGGGAALAATAVSEARAAGRPIEPDLLGPGACAAVERALTRARRRGGLADPAVRRLAAEQASAREA